MAPSADLSNSLNILQGEVHLPDALEVWWYDVLPLDRYPHKGDQAGGRIIFLADFLQTVRLLEDGGGVLPEALATYIQRSTLWKSSGDFYRVIQWALLLLLGDN